MTRPIVLLAALALAASEAVAAVPLHDLSVRIDPQTRILKGRDRISFDSARPATLVLSARFRIDALLADGRRVRPPEPPAQGMLRIELPAARRIEISWSGKLAALDRSLEHRDTLSYNAPASGAEGTYLPPESGWYPAVEGSLVRYRLALELPAGQRGLMPGRLLQERNSGGRYRARFEFTQASEGITLIAGPYRIEERRLRTAAGTSVRLRTYFHPEIAGLARGYLDSIAGYLDFYERWIGAYPFSEFSIVSSPTPTGFGLPTLTYLGIDVLRLPFIRSTSLGHEVLHNWWGNGVYPDYAHGNWSEGLTTFMADYFYRERDGAAAASAARLAWLRDYAAMPPRDDIALADFRSRTHGASQIVGYHKSAMLFFMLRDAIGSKAFDRGIRRFWREHRFQIASWNDLRAAFESSSGRKLAPFFDQWLERPGAPELRIATADAAPGARGWRLNVTLSQGAQPFALSVPLAVRTLAGEIAQRVELSRERQTFSLDLAQQPLDVALDPELRLFRRLAPAEAPPILREAMLNDHPATVVPSGDAGVRAAARQLAARLFERSGTEGSSDTATLVAGLHADIDRWLARSKLDPRPSMLQPERGTAQVWTLRAPGGRAMVIVSARDANALGALERPLSHYGQQSWLVFEGAHALERGVWPAQAQVWKLDPGASHEAQ